MMTFLPSPMFLLPYWSPIQKVYGASLVAQTVKNLTAMQETLGRSLDPEDPLEKVMVTHSSILAWRIPWTEKPGGLQCTGSQRIGHNSATNTTTTTNPQPFLYKGYRQFTSSSCDIRNRFFWTEQCSLLNCKDTKFLIQLIMIKFRLKMLTELPWQRTHAYFYTISIGRMFKDMHLKSVPGVIWWLLKRKTG